MTITGRISGVTYNREKRLLLTIETADDCVEAIDDLGDRELEVEINRKTKKRSNTANNYMWALCTKIAGKMGISKDEVYRKVIVERGIFRDFHYLTETELKTLTGAWTLLGDGWIARPLDYEPDGEHRVLRCYYGSSRYNQAQMSALIDNLEEDARALGIEIISAKEKALLLDEWDEIQKKERTKNE